MPKKTVTVEIEQKAYNEILQALRNFGDYEIGGMLIGYKKAENQFAVSQATVADDTHNFNLASFVRETYKSIKILLKNFQTKRHNYIGEWHSHPKFSLFPSDHDVKTMKGILADPGYGVTFALLIIAKLEYERIKMEGFLFHKKLPGFVKASISNDGTEHMPRVDISV